MSLYPNFLFATVSKKYLPKVLLHMIFYLKQYFTFSFLYFSSEYLAIFKKTVAMHEVFLCRVAAHPILRKDLNFHVFLEYNQDVSIELIKLISLP